MRPYETFDRFVGGLDCLHNSAKNGLEALAPAPQVWILRQLDVFIARAQLDEINPVPPHDLLEMTVRDQSNFVSAAPQRGTDTHERVNIAMRSNGENQEGHR